MPFKDPEDKAAWRRSYPNRHAQKAAYYQKNRERILEQGAQRRAQERAKRGPNWKPKRRGRKLGSSTVPLAIQRQRAKERQDARYWRAHAYVLNLLGGRCVWPGCGIDDPVVLEIDHIKGDGNVYRRSDPSDKQRRGGLLKIERMIRRFGEAWAKETLQLLCANDHRRKTWQEQDHMKHRGGSDRAEIVVLDEARQFKLL